jgi:hypothetical protein
MQDGRADRFHAGEIKREPDRRPEYVTGPWTADRHMRIGTATKVARPVGE